MQRFLLPAAVILTIAPCQLLAPAAAVAQTPPADPPVGSLEWKIQAFSSAAPPEIAARATVLDWNDSLQAPATQIRAGTNGWTCLPVMAPPLGGYTQAVQAAPMCGDSSAMQWARAHATKTKPTNSTIGIAYMLYGDLGASNVNPYDTAATATNDWVVTGPHIMILPADPARISDIPTDHTTGAPFQMWKGTPYAHIMVPLGDSGPEN